jgi:nitrate reductase gamma subunit
MKSVKGQGLAAVRPVVVFGVLLIALGIAVMLIDNVKFTDKRTVIDAGPIKVTEECQHTIAIPTIAGVIAVVAGAALLFFGRQARS